MGPSSSIGAAMPDSRRPAVKVVVFQWRVERPPGIARRMAHGRVSGAIFVDAAVSSMKDQSLGIEVELTVEPGYAAAQDIGALLL